MDYSCRAGEERSPASSTTVHEASAAQREMWLAQRLRPECSFAIGIYAEVDGEVDETVLAGAVAAVVEETPALRTTFVMAGDRLCQELVPASERLFTVIDLTHGRTGEPDAIAWIRADLHRPRPADAGDLCAFVLIRVGPRRHVWYQRYHHSIIDGRSAALVVHRIEAAYAARVGRSSAPMPETAPRAEFASMLASSTDAAVSGDVRAGRALRREKRLARTATRLGADKQFWKDYMAGTFDAAWLSRTAPDEPGRPPAYSEVVSTYHETEESQSAARQMGVSHAQVWVAAIAVHFHLLVGRTDLQFSLPVTSCASGEETIPGMTSNVVPLRMTVRGTMRLGEVAAQARDAMRRLLRHQWYRGEDIRRDSAIRQDGWFGPAINIMHFERCNAFTGCRAAWHVPALGPVDDFTVAIADYGDDAGYQLILRDLAAAHTESELTAHAERLLAIRDALLERPEQTIEALGVRLAAQADSMRDAGPYAWRRGLDAAGCLRWEAPARRLAHMVRATAFGEGYANPLGLCKVVVRDVPAGDAAASGTAVGESVAVDAVVCVTRLERLETRSGARPGTLLQIEETRWRVATGSEDVLVSGFVRASGEALSAAAVASLHGLREGDTLPLIDDERAEQLTEAFDALVAHEPFWRPRLERVRALHLPYEPHQARSTAPVWRTSDWQRAEPQGTQGEQRQREARGEQREEAALAALSMRETPALASARCDPLLTAWIVYLARVTGETAFQLGWRASLPASARSWPAGLVARDVPMECAVDLERPFADALEAVRTERAQVEHHRTHACDLVARDPQLRSREALRSHRPWRIAVSLVDAADTCDHAEGGGEMLTLELRPRDNAFRWVYDASCLDDDQIARTTRHLLTLMEASQAAGAVDTPVGQLAILPAQERALLLDSWNDTATPYPEDRTIHELFEAQARDTPDALALVAADASLAGEALTYAELNAQANQLAHHLIALGVQPDARVAIAVERSLALVVGLLAILKAGGAYVPLDPTYPAERLGQILTDAAPAIVLTDAAGRAAVGASALAPLTIVHLDPLQQRRDRSLAETRSSARTPAAAAWAERPSTNPDPRALGLTSRHLAYVIYTSGSTGTPKGAMNEHHALVNRLVWMQRAYRLDATDVVLQKTPCSFDVSVWEFFWPLMSGATLAVLPPEAHKDPTALVAWIRRWRVTTMHFVPSMLGLFVHAAGVERCSSLRRVICSGEALPAAHVAAWQQRLPWADVHNLYGPTEAAIDVTAWACPRPFEGDIVPIGRPIANTQIYLLDRHRQPVPLGAIGELYIGGVGVARGYWNREELTAERFLHDPFSRAAGARMYKTGDLARYRSDGAIEFLGRNDFQVKIRGFRIELGEIEARLAAHPQVREAVVVAREGTPGEPRLVAYVVPALTAGDAASANANVVIDDADTPGAAGAHADDAGHADGGAETEPQQQRASAAAWMEALRAYLTACLPEYMVPSAFVRLTTLPVTPNGKLDRQTLPAPDDEALARRAFEAPVGETEQVLAALWQELLGVARVGRRDHFFELGGHSLLAVRLLARVRAALDVELPLATLFAQPTVYQLAQAIAAARGMGVLQAVPPIAAISREGPLPLSFAQQRLWFLAQLPEVSATYHIPAALLLRGDLDRTVLRRSLDTLVARHEALRTIFIVSDGEPRVAILPATTGLPVIEEDLRSVSDAPARRARLAQLAAEEARAPFDLARGPLIRGRLVQIEDDAHVFLLTQHHIVSDGWSLGIVAQELSALYRAFLAGAPDPLPALAIQYPDYAAWQRAWLTGDRLQRQAAYWREALAGAPVLLELPTDRPRPPQQRFAGASVPIQLDADLTRALRTLSAQHGTTLFMTLLAAWAAVLARLSGQHDLVIGVPTANRRRPETEALIGFFVNTLAVRVDLANAPSVADLLARVHSTMLAAQEHQDLPFEQVVEIVQPPRRLRHTPLFQVLFAWQSAGPRAPELPGLQVEVSATPSGISRFDLELDLAEQADADTIVGALHYATALFDEATIVRQHGYWRAMLMAMAADAAQPVDAIDLLAPAERVQLLETWNATAAPYPSERCLHELFEAQVRETPAALAVRSADAALPGGSFTYADLNAQANRLAHHLIALGVRPDTLVAIAVERSVALVVGLLAILKAGGAYVPLDPTYPAERLGQILTDAAPALLLADAAGRAAVGDAALATLTVVHLDPLRPRPTAALGPAHVQLDAQTSPTAAPWAHRPSTNPDPRALGLTPRHLAYVIYTSGSTGTPKGAMNAHDALVNRLTWMQDAYGLDATDVVLQKTPCSFDVSVWEFFWPLLAGATLAVLPPEAHKDPSSLIEHIVEWRVTTMHFVPSMLGLFVHADGVERCTSLRRVICSGEALPAAHVVACQQRLPAADLHNLYGPTEAAIDVTAWACPRPFDGDTVPIGRPIANTQIYLLDAHHQPVPLGAVGELYIGGVGVARGYWNRPELTAERFLRDPFSRAPGARLYKTGDLARYRPDGAIEFLGRNDFQVKIRGFRIELGEIEARLAEHPRVREAIVIARAGATGEPRLVAYVVPAQTDSDGTNGTAGNAARVGGATDVDASSPQPASSEEAAAWAEALRTHLAARLPEHMVPSAFVRLAALPVTPNGKLDRQALPAPDDQAYARRTYEPPLGETEQAVAALWQELLGVERVGRHDHFFELGGHSLLAVRLLARVRAALGVELPLSTLFAQPTVAELARSIADTRDAGAVQALPPIAAVSREGPLPLSFAQQRLWFLAQLPEVSATYHIAVALRLHGDLDRAALRRSLGALVARHEALRTVFVATDGEPRVEILPAAIGVPLLEHDLRATPDAEARLAQFAADEARVPFDLAQGPMIRGRLIQLDAQAHVLLLTQHHIVSDGWSLGIFAQELGALYGAFRASLPDPLPPLAMQYPDYAAWQRAWLTGERLQRQADYWRQALADAPVLLELPTDRPRPPAQSLVGAHVPVCIDAELTRALEQLSARHGVTLFMTILAAWAAVLARLSGQDDLVIGVPTANRRRQEAESLIGFFVNTLAVRVDLANAPTVAELLARVRTMMLAAQEHQDLPFEQVVEIVQPPRRLQHTPLFQVLFAWQNAGRDLPELSGLRVEAAGTDAGLARFDIELVLAAQADIITGGLTYAAALFDDATMLRQRGYLLTLLRSMVADSGQAVAAIELLAPDERALLVESWNATAMPYPEHRCVHELFAAQARRTPEAIAIVSTEASLIGGSLTYAALAAQANWLAHQLIGLGVRPDARIAVCGERSAALVIGLLAILEAGGAYVPLDPAYPTERLAQILTDADPVLVIADARGRAALGSSVLEGRIVLDLVVAELSGGADAPLATPDPAALGLASHHLAYIIYTSGSTGRPKGVMVEHRQLANLVAWHVRQFALGPGSRSAVTAGVAFDASTWEIWPALSCGATLLLAPAASADDASALLRWWEAQALDVTFLTTPLATLALMDGRTPAGLRYLLVGGDRLQRLPALLPPGLTVVNNYGPTENTVVATSGTVDGRDAVLHIGRPIANTRIYLLDAAKQLVPLGAVGEIYIGGAGVARGYWNRPALTAERFLRDPFSREPGARMYRTGDLARYLPDGHIEFLGRNDLQVKVRGFRIELGEIEARLATHPQVREAVVTAREDAPGEKRLVAYIVSVSADEGGRGDDDAGVRPRAVPESAAWAETFRAHLAAGLPEHMVPSAFVRMMALPVTPNGKLDRAALPAPDGDASVRRVYEPPYGEIEQELAALWQTLLGVERVGRHDHFFERGGHSLLAVRLLARVRTVLGVELPMATLFAQPTVMHLAEAIAEARAAGELQAVPPIAAISREGLLPLSFAQQRLWFLAQLPEVSATYHIPAALRLQGDLDRTVLRRSLDALVARHEALRTVFIVVDGEPRVEILPASIGLPVIEEDLRGVSDGSDGLDGSDRSDAEARLAQLAQLAAEEARAPFDLARGPLIRGRLVQVENDAHVFLLTQHHIVSDGWSLGIFAQELSALYRAFSAGLPDPLPPLAIQYPDYAAWQRAWLTGDRLQRQAAYWREALAGAPVLLELPTDRARPPQQRFAGASVPIHLDADLTRALRTLIARHGTTLFMTLLTAWAAVLARLSGQRDLVIGVPTANRRRPETEGLIGFFVNTLAVRVDLADAPTVADLLARVRATMVAAQEHQDLPFEQVVEIVQPPRRLQHTPLFQVLFAWQSAGPRVPELPGLRVDVTATTSEVARFDLELDLAEQADADVDTIAGALHYATALFDEATVVRHRGYWHTMLRAMVADAAQPVEAVDLLAPDERVQLLETWNATAAPYPAERCLHELFEAQVRETPQALAVLSADASLRGGWLTYADLNTQANRLAHQLIALGVRPDALVAIAVERSVALVVGLLAILKAGGAYVPLDPTYPAERLGQILTDAAPALLLADAAGRAAIGEAALAALTVVDLDPLRPRPNPKPSAVPSPFANEQVNGRVIGRSSALAAPWAHRPSTNPDARGLGLTAKHLAYVIYTSGSTGTPKGAMNEHHALVNRLTWMQRAYRLDATDVVLQKTPCSFDVSVWEFFWPLLTGATLAVLPPEAHKDPRALIDRIAEWRVTTIHFVPSMLGLFVHAEGVERCTSLRRVICSGEALPAAHVVACQERLPAADLHNLYGPTEAAIDVTAWPCPRPFDGDSVPIGRPIANTQIHLLDDRHQPVPLGAVGELYIGGVGVARGYWNRPELTAERFLRDPFSRTPGARLYKTGDLACYRPDGAIEFLGRNDFQVKIRGFRIELGEIEARLSEHAHVREAVVIARAGATGEPRLVAYVVPAQTDGDGTAGTDGNAARVGAIDVDATSPQPASCEEPAAWAEALRAHLGARLPEHMVPSAFVRLAALPVTPNGKLDREALPAPDDEAFARRVYEAPLGETEEAIAALWQELLGVERVGRHDHFFELGGHSLLAVRLLSQLQSRLDVRIELSTLFNAPQLAPFAKKVLLASIEQEFDAIEFQNLVVAEDRTS